MSAHHVLFAAISSACVVAALAVALRAKPSEHASHEAGARFPAAKTTKNGCREETFPASPSGPGYDVRIPSVTTRFVVVVVSPSTTAASFFSRRLSRYLAWLGNKASIFDHDPSGGSCDELSPCDEHCHPVGQKQDEGLAGCADDLKHFFGSGGLVAIVRGGFTSRQSRQMAEHAFSRVADEVLYLWIDDRLGTLVEPLTDQQNYIRLAANNRLELQGVHGYLPARMASFLTMSWPRRRRRSQFYFSRHGESEYNLDERLGGDPPLTAKGRQDAQALKGFIATLVHGNVTSSDGGDVPVEAPPLQIWTSQLARTIQTGQPAEVDLGVECRRWRCLNEIHTGVCEHMTYADVRAKYPHVHEFRSEDKYAFRYPRGESYQDLVARLEPVILALENLDRPVVVIAHQAILRALIAYFRGDDPQRSVVLDIPHRTVWRCTILENGETDLATIPLAAE